MVKTVGKYQIGKTLGEGTFGKVKFAMNTETGESVAIKVLDKERIQKQSMGAQVFKLFVLFLFIVYFTFSPFYSSFCRQLYALRRKEYKWNLFLTWSFVHRFFLSFSTVTQIKREISIMKLVHHKSIVKLMEV